MTECQRFIVPVFLLWFASAWTVGALAVEPEVDAEVRRLLDEVGESGCDFERNGTRHNARDAASHLALKYDRGVRYVEKAEDFMYRLASESSWSGKPYYVICDDERSLSGEWLHELLVDMRAP
jgi:hypothetical protein